MDYNPLFIFEMANNHQGSVDHGKRIIREIREVCDDYPEFDYAFKFQYRDLDTFIHPDYQNRMDIKNIKRFQETRLSQEQFSELLSCVRENRFISICTPFDEVSVERIVEQEYDYIKVASCSFTDWPLLEEVAKTKIPVIASGAGSCDQDVRRVVSFFTNRGIELSLMHCVAEYPTPNDHLELNQIDYYRMLYPDIRIGFSTHENPDDTLPIKMAVAKGARIFEKHVGVPTGDIVLNGYSANPNQVGKWLAAAREAFLICGVEGKRYESSEKEKSDLLALRRGVFAREDLKEGDTLSKGSFFLAFPSKEGQITANEMSKYTQIILNKDTSANASILSEDVSIINGREKVLDCLNKVVEVLKESGVVIPTGSSCEISHHYGIDRFSETGVAMIDCINREYCKKILVMLPGQNHPTHYHVKKEESFIVLHGELTIVIDGIEKQLNKGDVITVGRCQKHSFSSKDGCVFEEISSTHYLDDSFYEEKVTFVNPRKTMVYFTKEMLELIKREK